jgi:hypothetical protein
MMAIGDLGFWFAAVVDCLFMSSGFGSCGFSQVKGWIISGYLITSGYRTDSFIHWPSTKAARHPDIRHKCSSIHLTSKLTSKSFVLLSKSNHDKAKDEHRQGT